jgi:ABC-type phosphate transport system substrate-binding protein
LLFFPTTSFIYQELPEQNSSRIAHDSEPALCGLLQSQTFQLEKYMKKILINVLSIAFLFGGTLSAQQRVSGSQPLKEVRFAHSLLERWLAEYTKENTDLQTKRELQTLVGKESQLGIVAVQPADSDLITQQTITYVGRYALLPVIGSKNPLLVKTPKNGLSKKQLKKLLFDEADEFAEESKEEKKKVITTVYSRGNQAFSTLAIARYFGAKPEELKGKRILGDDIYLLSAIRKDSTGIAYNSLNYVFDTQSRKLNSSIALVPLNVKPQQKEVLNSSDLDNTLSLLEHSNVENIPVEKIGFVLSRQQSENKVIASFVKWILTKGQRFNHQEGFLQLDEATLAGQKAQINEKLLSSIQ